MDIEDWLKIAVAIVGSVVGLYLIWEVGGVAVHVMGNVADLLATFVTWLLVCVMGILSILVSFAAVAAIGWLGVYALNRAIAEVGRMFARFDNASKDAAVDATVIAVLAGIIGLVAYMSTGDFLKLHELSLAKGVAVSAICMVILKIALYADSSVLRKALWPLIVICYLSPFALGAWQLTEGCSLQSTWACLMEVQDDEEKTPDATAAHDTPVQSAAQERPHADAASVEIPAAKAASEPGAVALASASAGRRESAIASEPTKQDEAPPARTDTTIAWRQHTMLVFGHGMIFLLALMVMLFPFSLRGWKRLLGI